MWRNTTRAKTEPRRQQVVCCRCLIYPQSAGAPGTNWLWSNLQSNAITTIPFVFFFFRVKNGFFSTPIPHTTLCLCCQDLNPRAHLKITIAECLLEITGAPVLLHALLTLNVRRTCWGSLSWTWNFCWKACHFARIFWWEFASTLQHLADLGLPVTRAATTERSLQDHQRNKFWTMMLIPPSSK